MQEEWAAIPGFEGQYEVSNHGRVKSVLLGGLLRPGLASNGYYTVALRRMNTRTVHSLVAEAFLGPRPAGCEVLHLNGDRTDSRAVNLKYGTRSENNRQIVRDGRRKLTVEQIRGIRARLSEGETGVRLAAEYGVSMTHISNIKHRRYYVCI